MVIKTNYKKTSGFSMIELLVVSTIIIVLSAIGMISYRSVGINSRNSKRKADLETVRQALVMYKQDKAIYPSGNVFTDMLSSLVLENYISDDSNRIVDPKSAGVYFYSYNSAGATFTVCAAMEPDEEAYCIDNP